MLDIHRRISTVGRATIERLRAEFAGLRAAWSIMRLQRIADVVRNKDPVEQLAYHRDVKRLAQAFVLDFERLRSELGAWSVVALRLFAACGADRLSTHFDNKQVWKRFLDPNFVQQNFPTRPDPFHVMPVFVRIYIQLLDGECQVERDLGVLRALLESHAGPMNPETVDDNVLLVLCGPTNAADLVTRGADKLYPTGYSKECVALWRELHGARVGCAPGKDIRKARKRTPGFKTIRSRVLAAAAHVRRAGVRTSDLPTAFGVRASEFNIAARAEQSPYWTKKLKAFAKLSAQKKAEHLVSPVGKRVKLTKMQLRHAGCVGQPVASHVVAFVPAECSVFTENKQELTGVHRCRDAQIVVVDTIARLHEVLPADSAAVINMIYITGLGKQVTTLESWARFRGNFVREDAARFVIGHQAVPKTTPVEFVVKNDFKNTYAEVVSELRAACSAERKWCLVREFTVPPRGVKQVCIDSLSNLWEWLQIHRRIVNARGKAKVWCDGGRRLA